MYRTLRPYAITLLCGCATVLATLPAQAQVPANSIDSLAIFQAIPSNPVFGLMGINGQGIQQPGTISQALVSIVTALDNNGKLSPGYAIALAPYQLIKGGDITLNDYLNSAWTRILTNSQLSLGTASAQDGENATDWGIGLKLVLANSGDARQDTAYINQLLAQAQQFFNQLPTPGVGNSFSPADIQRLTAGVTQKIDSLNAALDAVQAQDAGPDWNATFLDLDVGVVYRSTSNSVDDSRFRKYAGQVNGGIGGADWQVIGQLGSFMQLGMGIDTLGTVPDSSFVTGAVQARYGGKDFRIGLGANLEGSYDDFENRKGGQLAIVAELRINADLWLTVDLARTFAEGARPTPFKPNFSLKIMP